MITPEILQEYLNHWTNSIYSGGVLAQIETYSKSKRVAKVNPLYKQVKNGKDFPLPVLVDVPVMTFYAGDVEIIPDYKKGDIVQVICNVFSVVNSAKGIVESIDLASTKRYSLENAIIIGGLAKSTSSVPAGLDKDGLVIAHKSGFPVINLNSSQITIQTNSSTIIKASSSDVEIESTNITIKGTKITLDGEVEIKKRLTCKDEIFATKSITSDEDVKAGATSLKNHTHTGNLGAPTSPPQ